MANGLSLIQIVFLLLLAVAIIYIFISFFYGMVKGLMAMVVVVIAAVLFHLFMQFSLGISLPRLYGEIFTTLLGGPK